MYRVGVSSSLAADPKIKLIKMKTYPSVQYYKNAILGSQIIAFDKLDGQNIRCEWSKNKGWYKFGTRTSMFDESNEQFGKAIPLFREKYSEGLEEIFRKNKNYRNTKNFVVFCEYVGENSFAGRHVIEDEKDIILFDVAPGDYTNNSFIEPKEFVKEFRNLGIPKIIYQGPLTEDFINSVRENKYNLKEGVMCKGVNPGGAREVWIVKIKTNAWLQRLKTEFGDEILKEELNGDLSLL